MSDWLDAPYSIAGKTIWVAGASGLVGGACIARLENENCRILSPSRATLDCRNQSAVETFMAENNPDIVIIAAAKVGGIQANMSMPAEFIYDNLMIEAHIMHAAYKNDVEKLLFLGSSCIYPDGASNPIAEDALLSGALHPSNAPYALAKISGIQMCQAYRAQYGCNFIAAMPCSLYGPGDRFDVENSHVIPALMMKMHAAKLSGVPEVSIWGSGQPRREFLYSADLADALVFLLRHYSGAPPINVGAGVDITIADLALLLAEIVGFSGACVYETSRPDGVAQKLLDSGRLYAHGWQPITPLEEGLRAAYQWYIQNMQGDDYAR